MGWETSLPCHWPHDNSRRSMDYCPGHNWLPGKGERDMCPHVNLLTQQPFRFDCPRDFPMKDTPGDASSGHPASLHWSLRGWDLNRHQRDQRQPLPQLPSPSLDHGFESDRNSLSKALLMSSMWDRSERYWHSQHGRWHRENWAHMKINLPVFKDKAAKDAVTYQCWRWIWQCTGMLGVGITSSYHMPSSLYRVIPMS